MPQRHAGGATLDRLAQDIARLRPTRPAPVKNKHIPCPDCGAPSGQRCFNSSGAPTTTAHKSRQRLAARERNAELAALRAAAAIA